MNAWERFERRLNAAVCAAVGTSDAPELIAVPPLLYQASRRYARVVDAGKLTGMSRAGQRAFLTALAGRLYAAAAVYKAHGLLQHATFVRDRASDCARRGLAGLRFGMRSVS